jgi:hypothetical protein
MYIQVFPDFELFDHTTLLGRASMVTYQIFVGSL